MKENLDNQNQPLPEEEFLSYEEILEEYRRRQMLEHLTGPVISLILHVIVLGLMAFFLAGREIVTTTPPIEFDVTEIEVKPIDEEILEQLDRIEPDLIRDVVPQVDVPDVQPDMVDTEVVDQFADDMAQVDLDMDFATQLDVRESRSPLVLPGVLSSRADREGALRRHAGPYGRQTEAAVVRALEWLKNNQNDNGSWSGPGPGGAAMTGLAVLAFLSHNETPGTSERYGGTVQKGIQFLNHQVMNNGWNYRAGHGGAYTNGIVAYALSESYSMTRMPIIKPAMNEALQRIVDGQQNRGGWDYGYAKGDRWDLSVSGWQVQALKAGYMAGAEVEGLPEAMDKAVDFLKNVTFHRERGFGYSSPGGGSLAVQGAGTLGLQLLGEMRSREVQRGVEIIDQSRRTGGIDWDYERIAYAAYYMTQAIFHAGTRHFRNWNNELAPILVRNQNPDGSWQTLGDDGRFTDPVLNTTLNAMSLMVYYRFLPTFQDPGEREEAADIFSIGEDELSL